MFNATAIRPEAGRDQEYSHSYATSDVYLDVPGVIAVQEREAQTDGGHLGSAPAGGRSL